MRRTKRYKYHFNYYKPDEWENRSYPDAKYESGKLVVEETTARATLEERGPEYQYYEDGMTVKSIDFEGTLEVADKDAAWEEALHRVWDTGNWADEEDEQFFRVFYDFERRPKSRETLRIELAHGLTHEWTGRPVEKYEGNRVYIRMWLKAEDLPSAWGKAIRHIKKYKGARE